MRKIGVLECKQAGVNMLIGDIVIKYVIILQSSSLRSIMKLVYTFLLSLLLIACGGKNFIRPDSQSLVVGVTSYADVVKQLGEPLRKGTLTKNELTIQNISYSYAEAIPFSTSLSSRAMVFYFYDGLLVGYDYASSFSGEKQAAVIDDEKVAQLKKGDKKEKVLALLGTPSGELIFPMIVPKGNLSVMYSFISTSRTPFAGGMKVIRKVVTITVDPNGLITDISSSESKPS